MITCKQILKAIGNDVLKLHKGEGYFYFEYTTYSNGVCAVHETHSVYVNRLSHLALDHWVEEGNSLLEKVAA